jgi:hypothetical protein
MALRWPKKSMTLHLACRTDCATTGPAVQHSSDGNSKYERRGQRPQSREESRLNECEPCVCPCPSATATVNKSMPANTGSQHQNTMRRKRAARLGMCALTLAMSGNCRRAKRAGSCPLDQLVRAHVGTVLYERSGQARRPQAPDRSRLRQRPKRQKLRATTRCSSRRAARKMQ